MEIMHSTTHNTGHERNFFAVACFVAVAIALSMLTGCRGCILGDDKPEPQKQCTPCHDCYQASWESVKTGELRCAHCERKMIGEQISTVWFGDGQAVSVLCRECTSRLSGGQQAVYFRRWYQQQPAEYRCEHAEEFHSQVIGQLTRDN